MSTLNTYNLKSPDSANTNLALDASGNVAIQAGSASAPSIYVAGDSNTGLYSLGADQLAVTTGGTGRLFIDSSGRVGIGTSAPSQKLHLRDSSGPLMVFDDATTQFGAIGSYAALVGSGSNDTFLVSSINSKPLVLRAPSGQTVSFNIASSEAMRIDSSGRLGIGTALCGAPLSFADTNEAKIQFNGDSSNFFRIGKFSGELRFTAGETSPGAFTFSSGGSEKARIDSSGRLLVGTSTVITSSWAGTSGLLQIAKNDFLPAGLYSYVSTAADGWCPYFELHRARGTQASPSAVLSDDQLGEINFYGHDGSTFIRGASIRSYVDGTPGTNDMPGRLVFSTTADGASSPTERMRITSGGFSYVYNNAGSTALIASTSAGSDTTVVLAVKHSATTITGGTDAYYIRANGSAGSASDVNLKKNIETTRDGYLEDLNRLRVVKYNWNGQEDTKPRELGLIAQEVEEVFPGLVCDMSGQDENGKKTTHKGIVYSVLPIMLLKALQEADAKIEAQSAFITSLEARLAALEAQ